MIGTIVNTCTIIVGSIVGSVLHRGIKEKYSNALYTGLGLASIGIGLNAFVVNMPKSHFPVLFILSIALGGVAGTALDIDGRFKRLIEHFSKDKTNNLANGLATAILLYCIGPLSMLGPVVSALKGDHTFLFTNATLDFCSSIVFASTYGIGMIVARLSSQAVSDDLMAELLIVGGLLITGSGLALLRLKDCKTLNLLPALLVPILWFIVKALL